MDCPNCGEDSLVWDGNWEDAITQGNSVEDAVVLTYLCEHCGACTKAIYVFSDLVCEILI